MSDPTPVDELRTDWLSDAARVAMKLHYKMCGRGYGSGAASFTTEETKLAVLLGKAAEALREACVASVAVDEIELQREANPDRAREEAEDRADREREFGPVPEGPDA